MKKTNFKKPVAMLLSLTMTLGNIGFVRANQITETPTNEIATNQEITKTPQLEATENELILPISINDDFKVYMDDSYKKDMPMRARRSLPLIINTTNMKLTIDQTNVSLLSSSRFDQLVSEMDEIIRLSKEFIGLDKNIIIPIEINSDTNLLISYPALLISGGLFKRIVETEINADRMDSIVYHLNNFVISYASNGGIKFWNNYINKFDMLMAAYCVESMGLTMQELSSTYYRENFTGGDYKNVFLWQYNKLMNSQSQNMSSNDMIWSFPYTMLRIKEKIGWEPFKVASNAILEQSKTNQYPYAENYNNFLNFLANSSQKNIYNMFTAKEIEKYEVLLDAKLGGKYDEIINPELGNLEIIVNKGEMNLVAENIYESNKKLNTITGQLVGDLTDVMSFSYKAYFSGAIVANEEIAINKDWTINNINLYDGVNLLEFTLIDSFGDEIKKEINIDLKNNIPISNLVEDYDNDGLSDYEEYVYETDPKNSDTDSDGISDYDEILLGTNPLLVDDKEDFDDDKLTNAEEFYIKTNIFKSDTDGDELSDGDEINIHNTDPKLFDTDDDGVSDGTEIKIGTNPLVKDSDNNIIYNYKNFEEDLISIESKVNLASKNIDSYKIYKTSDTDSKFSKDMPGYVTNAIEVNSDEKNCKVEMTVKVDKSLIEDGEIPKFYSMDPVTGDVKEIEGQVIDESMSRGLIGAFIYYTFNFAFTDKIYLFLVYTDRFIITQNNARDAVRESLETKSGSEETNIVLITDSAGKMHNSSTKHLVEPTAKKIINKFIKPLENVKIAIMDYSYQPLWFTTFTNNLTFLNKTISSIASLGTSWTASFLDNAVTEGLQVYPYTNKSKSFSEDYQENYETKEISNDSFEKILNKLNTNEELIISDEELANIENRLNIANEFLSDSKNSSELEIQSFANFLSTGTNKHIIMITQGNVDMDPTTIDSFKLINTVAIAKNVKIHIIQTEPTGSFYIKDLAQKTGGEFIALENGTDEEIDKAVELLYSKINSGFDNMDLIIDDTGNGISNFFEKKLNEGLILSELGLPLSSLATLNHNKLIASDTDGDGLKDGNEIGIKFEITEENLIKVDDYLKSKLNDVEYAQAVELLELMSVSNPKTGRLEVTEPVFKFITFTVIEGGAGATTSLGAASGAGTAAGAGTALITVLGVVLIVVLTALIIYGTVQYFTNSNPLSPDSDKDGIADTDESEDEEDDDKQKMIFGNENEKVMSINYEYPLEFKYNYDFFKKSNDKYDLNIAKISSIMSTLAYKDGESLYYMKKIIKDKDDNVVDEKKYYLTDYMKLHGFVDIETEEATISGSKLNFHIGKKDSIIFIPIDGGLISDEDHLAILDHGATIDPVGNANWLNKENHKLYDDYANKIYEKLKSYSAGQTEDTVVWITGHGFGGAVANILAEKIEHDGNMKSFVYTFATPNTTTSNKKVVGVFNFINTEDLMVRTPSKFILDPNNKQQPFTRYGQDVMTSFSDNTVRVKWSIATKRKDQEVGLNEKDVKSVLSELKTFSKDREKYYEMEQKIVLTNEITEADFKASVPEITQKHASIESDNSKIKHSPMFALQILSYDLIEAKKSISLDKLITSFKYVEHKASNRMTNIFLKMSSKDKKTFTIKDEVTNANLPDAYLFMVFKESQTIGEDDYQIENSFDFDDRGAAFTDDTDILVRDDKGDRYVPINEITAKDRVVVNIFDKKGNFKEQTTTFPSKIVPMGLKKIFKIKTANSEISSSEETTFCVKDDHKDILLPANLIKKGDRIKNITGAYVEVLDVTTLSDLNKVWQLKIEKKMKNGEYKTNMYVEYFISQKEKAADIRTNTRGGLREEENKILKEKFTDLEIRYINNAYTDLFKDITLKILGEKESYTPAAAITMNKTTGETISKGYNENKAVIESYPKQFKINFEDELNKAENENLKSNLEIVQEMKKRSDFINENFKHKNLNINPITNKPYVDEPLDKHRSSGLAGSHAEVHAAATALLPLDEKSNINTKNLISKENLITFVIRTENKDFGEPFHRCAHCSFILEGLNAPADFIETSKNPGYEDALKEYNDLYNEKLKNITGSVTNIYDNVVYRDYIFGVAS